MENSMIQKLAKHVGAQHKQKGKEMIWLPCQQTTKTKEKNITGKQRLNPYGQKLQSWAFIPEQRQSIFTQKPVCKCS
jgi:hypothetical protein